MRSIGFAGLSASEKVTDNRPAGMNNRPLSLRWISFGDRRR